MATNLFYAVMFKSSAYTLHYNTTNDRKTITTGELVVKSKYLCSVQVDSNWYWGHHAKRYVITIPTCTILHPRLKVNVITDIHDIPKNVCNRTKAKKAISRYPICLTDSYYD